MVKFTLASIVFTIGCGGGSAEESMVSDLRTMAIVPATPEASPGETLEVEVYVLDPEQTGSQVWLWSCSGFSDLCIETAEPQVLESVQLNQTFTLTVPDSLPPGPDPIPVTTIWVATCTADACSKLSEIDLSAAYPFGSDVDVDGLAISRQSLFISSREASSRETHPTVTGPDSVFGVKGDDHEVEFVTSEVEGGVLWLYTTLGGYERASVDVAGTGATVVWTPEEAGVGTSLVVFQSPEGGQSVWSFPVEAE